eukprot:CAMPEP_0174738462 /NCGR_PEP_ID=MMETSP1094-20130205/69998_1 /TAXON_ID=156173 /ORGANISM="Chrysochromulina brevifilum, Strain UTEX LB 985" /LENGTH=215 /DNA_ID=CAMNT_0015941881 /DNA_START=34 /DNA_END=678 /DNA_ORIENTATION=+
MDLVGDDAAAYVQQAYRRRMERVRAREAQMIEEPHSPHLQTKSDNFPPQDEDNDTVYARRINAAAAYVQRVYRRRRDNRAWGDLIRQLPELRSSYMDEAALRAGADNNPLYSDMMIAAREALRTKPAIIAALDEAWHSMVPHGHNMPRKMYYTMSRKLYLTVIVQDAEEAGFVDAELLDPGECLRSIDEDWEQDSAGQPTLDREAFHRCVFQLAD